MRFLLTVFVTVSIFLCFNFVQGGVVKDIFLGGGSSSDEVDSSMLKENDQRDGRFLGVSKPICISFISLIFCETGCTLIVSKTFCKEEETFRGNSHLKKFLFSNGEVSPLNFM